ncbi:DUF4180 domain-containing protein [Phenylobacterium sp.]|uniref:DUF4180 domain-containing protein n=1 Tax=Phenylobacterium sp. TaxID=1871053 RepID=UPI0012260B34|nr:DUF4180 domain-containing protein [Phenylobacterium sp.]THD60982.1 MAG: DUF4180 domain-containing protein [Phenylobacterium sp.]
MGEVRNICGRPVYVCADEGPSLADNHELSGLIGDLFSLSVRVVAIPLARLGPDFLKLSSGVAGEVLQKLVNYRVHVAILGDISAAQARSAPLRDFIRESNRGQTVWFVDDLEALAAKLTG